MITLKELDNGNLKIILNDKEELIDLLNKNEYDNILLASMLDTAGYIGNNWWIPQCIGLTEAPAIGYGQLQDENDPNADNGFTDEYEKVWYFDDYMIRDMGAELLRDGEFILTKL